MGCTNVDGDFKSKLKTEEKKAEFLWGLELMCQILFQVCLGRDILTESRLGPQGVAESPASGLRSYLVRLW